MAEEYAPKVLLLTGGAGFIGSNVLVHFVKTYPDIQVVCLDKLAYCASTKNFDEIIGFKNFTFVKGDICSSDLVNHILATYKVDTIMHFAAETHVDNSFGNSFSFTQTNVVGTHVLLEAAKLFMPQIRRFIHVSTDEVYGESQMGDEEERKTVYSALNPTNPYSASKAAAEFMVKGYQKSFKLPIIITRGNNVYGPKQYPEKLIPKFIHLLASGRPCPLHGDGSNLRSFLYVDDVVQAFDLILRKGKLNEVYNIGSDAEISNRDVLMKLIEQHGLADEKEKYMTFVEDRAFNDKRYHIGNAELKALGWDQKFDFDKGLAATIEWYKSRDSHWGNVNNALSAHPGKNLQKREMAHIRDIMRNSEE